jgi:shikimate dehydrogenase
MPDLDPAILNPNACCYDMMYGAQLTLFLQWAQRHGAKEVADGLGMLVEQAAESFYLWRGVRPETKAVMEQLRRT